MILSTVRENLSKLYDKVYGDNDAPPSIPVLWAEDGTWWEYNDPALDYDDYNDDEPLPAANTDLVHVQKEIALWGAWEINALIYELQTFRSLCANSQDFKAMVIPDPEGYRLVLNGWRDVQEDEVRTEGLFED